MRKRVSKKIYFCTLKKTKKYKNRDSPPYSAQDCPYKKKKGNNGKIYISIPSDLGIFTWKPINKTRKK